MQHDDTHLLRVYMGSMNRLVCMSARVISTILLMPGMVRSRFASLGLSRSVNVSEVSP